ncbi:hypothetical protein FTV88_0129 [Heliorestis convoluta]|uniref:Uncharacterized protein n=2 Tax=Heliorestis convoluta TaxID=356322 RepID=A0A5Q2MVT6_9FIRM|nr:hypothetical protein FTV88_0129 [Heliorestis convoluta]
MRRLSEIFIGLLNTEFHDVHPVGEILILSLEAFNSFLRDFMRILEVFL